MNPTAKTIEQLGCIGDFLCVGGRCHRRFTIFVVLVINPVLLLLLLLVQAGCREKAYTVDSTSDWY